ncbi:MAG TPA: HAD family hydrolase [Verrucomicrobiae bacterium]|nr:HAD family hydrolase [Verrucomicrobiae bacterium]
MPIRAVLFDMFDTLMMIKKNDEFYSPALMRMYGYLNKKGVNISFDTFQKAYIKTRDGLYAKADANLEEPHFNVRVSKTLKSLGYNYTVSSPIVAAATAEFCDEFMTFVYLDENIEELLRVLHGKYKLGIISNFAIPECVHKLLKTHNLDKLFDAIVISGAVNKRKPSPEIFKRTLKVLGVSASETVFVGDTLDADIEGAKAVGMKAVYIERRSEKVEHVSPDQTIKSLSELPIVLSRF